MRNREARRVAVIGGIRIPFCRAHTAYARCSNQDMMTAVLRALVARYSLAGQRLGRRLARRRDQTLARFQSGSRVDAVVGARARDAGVRHSARLRHEPVGRDHHRQRRFDGPHRGRHRGRHRLDQRPADRLSRRLPHAAARERARALARRAPRTVAQAAAATLQARSSRPSSSRARSSRWARAWRSRRKSGNSRARIKTGSRSRAIRTPRARTRKGFYEDLVVEFQGVKRDNNIRTDTSLEQLAKLKPVFDRGPSGTLTAGNSTPLTDGASAVLLASEEWAQSARAADCGVPDARARGAVDFVAQGRPADGAGVRGVRDARRSEPELQDFDFYEIHEAFAAQTLVTLKAWESEKFCRERLGRDRALGSIDRSKLNVKGGSVAVGHPFAATGTTHPRHAREAAARARPWPRLDLRLHGRRHGRHGDPRSGVTPAFCSSPTSVGSMARAIECVGALRRACS